MLYILNLYHSVYKQNSYVFCNGLFTIYTDHAVCTAVFNLEMKTTNNQAIQNITHLKTDAHIPFRFQFAGNFLSF